jgi:hypothetical protein
MPVTGMIKVMLLRGRRHGRAATHRVTVTVDPGAPGPAVPADFAGLSFERGPLNPGHAGVENYLFSPENSSLVTLLRSMGLRSLRIGGGSVDHYPPAGTGPDGFTGIDQLFAFAAAAGARVIYSFRLLSPAGQPASDLISTGARAAGYIWRRYTDQVASFAIGNEPDWHAAHTYPGHPLDPAIYETDAGVPGSAYPSYLATWRRFAAAIADAAPGAPLCGPDAGAYSPLTHTDGVSWTERFAGDERDSGRVAEVTQHYYAGGDPGQTTARQAISNMLSPEWVRGTARGSQPRGTTYTPYPWLYRSHLAPVAAAGLRYRLTESNDYLTGVPGASNAFASALWALDHLHWWAAHGAAGVNFHNKQWLWTGTVVPDPGRPGRYAVTPKGYGIRAFTVGSAGQCRPVTVGNPDGLNITAYGTGGPAQDCVTLINKTHGPRAAAADVTIVPATPAAGAEYMLLTSRGPGAPGEPGEPGDATAPGATLGGALITGDGPWEGTWNALPSGPAGIRLTVPAATAAIVRIGYGPGDPPP